jgi:hypothetical protein
MSIVVPYAHLGGEHPETAAAKNLLAARGFRAPHTDQPYSEAMLLGIGGGLGAGYILWEFKQHASATMVLGLHHNWNYPVTYFSNICERVGARPVIKETGGRQAAAAHLAEILAQGLPAIAWIHRAYLPYTHIQDEFECANPFVVVYGIGESDVLLDDRSRKPFRVDQEAFAAARARIGSYKNRLLTVEPPTGADLEAAILAGIRDCVEYLGRPSDSFALPAIQKWGKLTTDPKNKKGWPTVFRDRTGLYDTLRSMYEGVALMGGGNGLRGLYADFLDEAGPLVARPALREVAAQYRALAAQWAGLAHAALPDDIAALRETRELLRRRHDLLTAEGGEGEPAARALSGRLAALRSEANAQFPMGEAEVRDLFSELQERLLAIYEGEKRALAGLGNAV